MRRAILVHVLVTALVACAGNVPDTARREAPIVNGQPDSGHLNVGRIDDNAGGFCTGTLVGKKTLLTAAHCIEPGLTFVFVTAGGSYPVVKAVPHPAYNGYLDYEENDIAVMILAAAPPLSPAAVATQPPTVGQQVVFVGFGTTGEYVEDEAKRMGTAVIGWVQAKEFGWKGSATTSASCYGDSGGPALARVAGQEAQVGVVSRSNGICGFDDVYTRVDAYLSWLLQESEGDLYQGHVVPTPDAHVAVDMGPALPDAFSRDMQPVQPDTVQPDADPSVAPLAGGCATSGGRRGGVPVCILLLVGLLGDRLRLVIRGNQ